MAAAEEQKGRIMIIEQTDLVPGVVKLANDPTSIGFPLNNQRWLIFDSTQPIFQTAVEYAQNIADVGIQQYYASISDKDPKKADIGTKINNRTWVDDPSLVSAIEQATSKIKTPDTTDDSRMILVESFDALKNIIQADVDVLNRVESSLRPTDNGRYKPADVARFKSITELINRTYSDRFLQDVVYPTNIAKEVEILKQTNFDSLKDLDLKTKLRSLFLKGEGAGGLNDNGKLFFQHLEQLTTPLTNEQKRTNGEQIQQVDIQYKKPRSNTPSGPYKSRTIGDLLGAAQ
jgi:hypothetical protein